MARKQNILKYILRLFWGLTIILAAAGAISLAHSNWVRFEANPTVVSLQKDFRNWENPFPSVSGCFLDKTDLKKAEAYILQKWDVSNSDAKYEYYLEFIKTVSNISYQSMDQFEKYANDATLHNADMWDIATKVHPKLSGTLVTFDAKRKTKWQLVMTELGICFVVNSKFANIFSLNSNQAKTISADSTILHCHYLNGQCYARYDSDPKLPLKYYIHSYLDVVHATAENPLLVGESEELEINYRLHQTVSAPTLNYLKPSQRRCRFDDEPLTKEIPMYSSSVCYIMCRYRLVYELCGCKPFFYSYLGGKVCSIKGLLCVAKYAKNITMPPSEIGCKCPQPCNLITYMAQIPKFTKWEHGYFDQRITFRWGLLSPTTKYRRDILFGIEDLIVSFGGIIALFLGISSITLIELLFLTVEALIKWYKNM